MLLVVFRVRWEGNTDIELKDTDCQDRRWMLCYSSTIRIAVLCFDIWYRQIRWTVIKMLWWKSVPWYKSNEEFIQSWAIAVQIPSSMLIVQCNTLTIERYTCTQTRRRLLWCSVSVVWQGRTKRRSSLNICTLSLLCPYNRTKQKLHCFQIYNTETFYAEIMLWNEFSISLAEVHSDGHKATLFWIQESELPEGGVAA